MATPHKLLLTLCAVGLWATPALALDNDPHLDRLCVREPVDVDGDGATDRPCGNAPAPDQQAFSDVVREYGMAFAPRLLAPAETLGVNGFNFGFHVGLTNINDAEEYWARTIEDEAPPPVLTTLHLDARKGLPYSLEVGASMSWLAQSELFGLGGSIKWAPNEGVDAFPVDFAARFTAVRVVGSSQLDLTTLGLDLVLSRGFGVGGVANIAPYMAYSPAFIFARSGVLDSTPGCGPSSEPDADGICRQGGDPERSFVFEKEELVLHRFVVGTRLVIGAVNFTPEIALTKGLQSYNFNLGLDF